MPATASTRSAIADRLRLRHALHRLRTAGRCANGWSPRSTARSRSRPASSSRPGPTTAACPARRFRCTEGERLRIRLPQRRQPSAFDAFPRHPFLAHGRRAGRRAWSQPGEEFVYEFDACPFGCHLYHCHALPLKRHIHKGMYGAFIVDPDPERHPDERAAAARAPPRHAGERALAGIRHGDERLRHQLRRRERVLRRQLHPLRLRRAADPHRARAAGAHLSRQRHRVRPDQLVPPARQLLRLLRPRHDADADAAAPSTR